MKYFFTLLIGFMFTGLIMAQTPLEFNIENKMNGTYIGNVPLELGTTFYIQKFELKAKKEQTPNSDGFFSPEEATDWLINESSFNAMDWTANSQTSGWNDSGDKFTLSFGDAWMLLEYSVEIQPYNANGNVGSPLIGNWNDFNGKELKSEYKAENCSVPFDSTSASKWKAEAKLKLDGPLSPTAQAIDPSADSLSIVVKDNDGLTIFSYTAAIEWVDPALFGMNVSTSFSTPANGLFYVPTETFSATIVLTNDGGDTLVLTNGAANKVEKMEVWISGPKHNYKNVPDYEKVAIVNGFDFVPESGYDILTHTLNVSLEQSSDLESGTYTLLVKAKRKGFGPEVEKYELIDFQVSSETLTTNPTESWAVTCTNCHELEKHKATEVSQCVVCHTKNYSNFEFAKIIHQPHATASSPIMDCLDCHANSEGNDVSSIMACASCHEGTITDAFPVSHSQYTDDNCSMCHSSGPLSPDEAHALSTNINSMNDSYFGLYSITNYPNPFKRSTVIQFSLGTSSFTNLTIYDVSGKMVVTLVNEQMQAGIHNIEFVSGNLPNGIYYYNITTDKGSESSKMILLK